VRRGGEMRPGGKTWSRREVLQEWIKAGEICRRGSTGGGVIIRPVAVGIMASGPQSASCVRLREMCHLHLSHPIWTNAARGRTQTHTKNRLSFVEWDLFSPPKKRGEQSHRSDGPD